MDTLKKSTIDEEIDSMTRKINGESFGRLSEELDKPLEKRINFFKKILYSQELQRAEPDWVVICKQGQNDHDEIWKHKDPGPDFTSADRPPGSSMLGKLLSPYLTKGVSHSVYRIVVSQMTIQTTIMVAHLCPKLGLCCISYNLRRDYTNHAYWGSSRIRMMRNVQTWKLVQQRLML
jgi:hypothetical protein